MYEETISFVGNYCSIIGTVVVAITLLTRRAHSISIIGGADGPTSVFLAGKVDPLSLIIGLGIGCLVLAVGAALIIKNRKE